MTKALATQASVIRALVLRETRTSFGAHRYFSLIWLLVEPAMHVAVFWLVFTVLKRNVPYGMPIPLFLLSGLFPYFLFAGTAQKCMTAIEGGRALLYYQQVTPIDLVLAKTYLEAVTNAVVLLILLALTWLAGYKFDIDDGLAIAAGLMLAALLGAGFGLVIASWSIVFPLLGTLIRPFFRILYFISGIFFTVESIPPVARDELLYNPVLHLTDQIRGGFFTSYTPVHSSFEYAAWFAFIVLALGLVSERMNRKKLIV
ncbi:MAG: ABC transporter permease [Syntrophobacteraceae bacterium]